MVNNHFGTKRKVTNLNRSQMCNVDFNRTEVHTEAEFISACGYVEEETIHEKEQRLIKELEEVQKAIKESEPKVGDICIINTGVVKSIQVVIDEDIKHFAEVKKLPKDLQEQLKPYFNV